MIEKEIERIGRIHIDQGHLSVVHQHLSKLQPIFPKSHVVSRRHFTPGRHWQFPAHLFAVAHLLVGQRAEGLNDVLPFQPNRGYCPVDVRGRQNLRGIEDEIVLICAQSLNLAVFDQIGDIDAQQTHQSFGGQMEGLDFLAVQADLTVGRGNETPVCFKRDIALA